MQLWDRITQLLKLGAGSKLLKKNLSRLTVASVRRNDWPSLGTCPSHLWLPKLELHMTRITLWRTQTLILTYTRLWLLHCAKITRIKMPARRSGAVRVTMLSFALQCC